MCLAVSGWSEGGERVLIKKTGSEESWEGETESHSWRGGVTDRSLTSLSFLLSWVLFAKLVTDTVERSSRQFELRSQIGTICLGK